MTSTRGVLELARPSSMWQDPDQGAAAGVLLSDRIKLYVEYAALITPFVEKNLSPASYNLTLGPDCAYCNHTKGTGKAERILGPGEELVILPNSIVFVSTEEFLNLPFYIVGRFNLKLRYLHEGLLVGTGPQIDPGFSGKLSCPLHNISSEKICLKAGSSFAVIEFEKTTPFAQDEIWRGDENLDEIRQRGDAALLKGIGGRPCKTFPEKRLDRKPVRDYLPPGKCVSSSVEGVAAGLDQLQAKTEKTLEGHGTLIGRTSIIAFVAVAVVALSVVICFNGMISWNRGITDAVFRAEEKVKLLSEQKEGLERRLADVEAKLMARQLDDQE